MQSKRKIFLTTGGICAFMAVSSLSGFTGWYQAIKISDANASLGSNEFLDSITLTPEQQKTWEAALENTQLETYDNQDLLQNQIIALNFAEPFITTSDIKPNITSATEDIGSDDIEKNIMMQQRSSVAILKKGDDLISMFINAGVTRSQAWSIVNAMKPHASPNKMPAGKTFQLEWDYDINQERTIKSVSFPIDEKSTLIIAAADEGAFKSDLNQRKTVKKILRGDVTIKNSLYGDGSSTGIPNSILSKMLKIYSWDVDFSREVKEGDQFSLLYTCEYDKLTGEKLNCDDILYATINLSKDQKELFSFEHDDGNVKYYSKQGMAAEKRFLRTPVDMSKARISSRMGARFHPISKTKKMHNGVDFAAPTGTPIFAAADGKIIKRERSRSAGNMIEINHGEYITVYMHQSKFASGLSVGSRVKQGQVIGYVGSTGYSTGPHLHYELRKAKNRAVVDPLKVSPISNNGVSRAEAAAFDKQKRTLLSLYDAIKPNTFSPPEEILAQLQDNSFVSADAMLKGHATPAGSQHISSQGVNTMELTIKERPNNL